jgi:hypothetical protein
VRPLHNFKEGTSGSPLACPGQGVAGELPGRAIVGLEQRRSRIAREARAVDVGVRVSLQIVMARHGVLLAAFLVQANPIACGSACTRPRRARR